VVISSSGEEKGKELYRLELNRTNTNQGEDSQAAIQKMRILIST
jgi:hypothetical protein